MLSPPELDLVRRDAALTGLAILLDPEAFADLLRGDAAVPVLSARRAYVRYKPAVSCLVAYDVTTPAGTVAVSARALASGSLEKLEKTRAIPSIPSLLGPGRLVRDDLTVVVSVFPNDRAIRVLPRLDQTEARRHLLERVFRGHPEFWTGTIQTLRYKPERRYVGRLLVNNQPVAVLKFYTEETFPAAFAASEALAEAGTLRLAPRFGRSRRHHVLAQGWCSGRLLADELTTGRQAPAELGAVGAALADLHAYPSDELPVRTHKDEALALRAAAEAVAVLLPAVAARASAAAGKIAKYLGDEPDERRTIHGDFYARQVLLADAGAILLDTDETAIGNPAVDLGQFLAHLERDVLAGRLPRNQAQAVQEGLLEAYARATLRRIPARVSAYTAAALFRLAPAPFREGEPTWPERIAAIVDRAEEILGQPGTARGSGPARPAQHGRGRARVTVVDSLGAGTDPAMPFVVRALDPHHAQLRLAAAFGFQGNAALSAIRVVRHKPGRRCVVEYEVVVGRAGRADQPQTVMGKMRAKGPDWAGHRLQEAFQRAGLTGLSRAGLCVAEPLGIIPDMHMVLQRKLAGEPSSQQLAGPDGPDLARRIAIAIHQLHQADVPAERRHTMADELCILHERLARLAIERPELAARLARLLARCDRLAGSMPPVPQRGIHRDFYADHVLVDGPRLGLIDFDLYCAGDPALDVGNFQAHLTEHALRHTGDASVLAEQEAALADQFARLAGPAVCRRVTAYALLTLVRHVGLSSRLPERAHLTEALLELCEDRLARLNRISARLHSGGPAECGIPNRIVEN